MIDKDRFGRAAVVLALAAALAGCNGSPPHEEEPHDDAEGWSVTAWGARYEVFAEAEPLVAGAVAHAHTHVTRLDGFAPLVDGEVEIVLAGPDGEQVFAADAPVRPGIFTIEVAAAAAGERALSFRIRDGEGVDEIRGGKVRVGTAERPGGLLVAPAPKGGSDGGEPVEFLKEEQWRSDFATEWVRTGTLARSVAGLARIRPPAGGEAAVTAPVDGVVRPAGGSSSWPFPGLRVARGSTLFRVVPHIAVDRSLATLEGELAALDAELAPARARLGRLEELLALEAASRRDLEEARARVEILDARRAAAARDLEAARTSRQGGAADGLVLRAPFAGEIAQVATSPGATVEAGQTLARLVRTDRLWIEVALPPAGARQIAEEGVRGVVLTDSERDPIRLEEGLRLVSVAPELAPRTGTVAILLEAPPTSGLALGTALDALVLMNGERQGVVIPASAVIDDGGVPVVYLQLSGERFARQEVRILERQGDRVLVERLTPGQRLVSAGGAAIRRSALMAGGDAHGHMH